MPKSRNNKKGVILFIVLGTLLVVTLLASAVLRLTASHYRLTRHEISRIQAYYMAMAGVNYAIEKLRLDDPVWSNPGPHTFTLCKGGCDINEPSLPDSIQQVNIEVGDLGTGIENTRQIRTTAIYTYTP